MLVLSRRENESIVFPKLGISVQIARLGGRVVKLGIKAPEDVRVFRAELVDDIEQNQDTNASRVHSKSNQLEKDRLVDDESQAKLIRHLKHSLRNRINSALLGLQLLQSQIENGGVDDLEGTVFHIFQRLSDLDSEIETAFQTAIQPMVSSNEGAQSADAKPLRALIVDDSVNEAQLLAQYLQLNGYSAEVVGNGREAIHWLQKNERPDIVLMDMNMPEMGGAETIHQIRSIREMDSLRVFGVSGLDQEESGVSTGRKGVDCWFTKPVDARKLLNEINRPQFANIA